MERFTIVVEKNGLINLPQGLWKALLNTAKFTQKGRRGLSSKKMRVRKKIIKEELRIAFVEYKNENT